MKKLLYLMIIMVLGAGCTHQGKSDNTGIDTVYIAPDSVWDYSGLPNYDSINQLIKADAYNWYGDSNADGLPDSIMAIKDSIERLRE